MKELEITIIVACLNSEKTIEKTLTSIKNQNYGRLEVIVVDGGSTDETIKLVRSQNFPGLIIISEPDKGIGDAWNKGLRVCRGDIIGILNSDDYYEENILQAISKSFSGVDVPLVGFGDVVLINHKNNSRKLVAGRLRGKWGLLNGFGFLHPSVFFNRQALDKVGLFNCKLHVAVDTDWLLRAVSLGIAFRKIPSLCYMQAGGVSDVNRYTGMGEYADALVRIGYSDLQMLVFFLLRFFGKLSKVFRWKKFND